MEVVSFESKGKSFKIGRVRLEVSEDGTFQSLLVHPTGQDYDIYLTLDLEDAKALLKVLEHLFGHWDSRPSFPPPRQLWERSNFRYLAPLVDRPETFWISAGPLNAYIDVSHMRVVYGDLEQVLKLSNIILG